jgi:hypothetical protein
MKVRTGSVQAHRGTLPSGSVLGPGTRRIQQRPRTILLLPRPAIRGSQQSPIKPGRPIPIGIPHNGATLRLPRRINDLGRSRRGVPLSAAQDLRQPQDLGPFFGSDGPEGCARRTIRVKVDSKAIAAALAGIPVRFQAFADAVGPATTAPARSDGRVRSSCHLPFPSTRPERQTSSGGHWTHGLPYSAAPVRTRRLGSGRHSPPECVCPHRTVKRRCA